MAIAQEQPIVPPIATDKFLLDFAKIIQANVRELFQAAHNHVSRNGVLTAAPKPTDGNPGDILIGQISGSTYLFVKADRSHWFRFGPGTAL